MIVQGNYRKGVVVVSSNCNIAPSLHSLILFTSTTSNRTCEISHSKISASCYTCVWSDLSIIMFWLSNLRWPQTMGQWLKYLLSHGQWSQVRMQVVVCLVTRPVHSTPGDSATWDDLSLLCLQMSVWSEWSWGLSVSGDWWPGDCIMSVSRCYQLLLSDHHLSWSRASTGHILPMVSSCHHNNSQLS